MKQIAALLTCFNRKPKTLEALTHLYKAKEYSTTPIKLDIYLTDDGSTDGTAEAVLKKFPEVRILKGTGELYWAGGMRNSWSSALKSEYHGYLLLNDDTNVFTDLFNVLERTEQYSIAEFGKTGIYIGSTEDHQTKKLSYGGAVYSNRFLAKYEKLVPSEIPQSCELGNANIMYVASEVVEKIGILSSEFQHGLADFDYTLTAVKKDIPVLITPGILGQCTNDNKNPYNAFRNASLKKRIQMLYHPIGLDFSSNLKFMKRNFPLRLPFVFLSGWLKVLFPNFYINNRKNLG